jgi:hypothetical protein
MNPLQPTRIARTKLGGLTCRTSSGIVVMGFVFPGNRALLEFGSMSGGRWATAPQVFGRHQ